MTGRPPDEPGEPLPLHQVLKLVRTTLGLEQQQVAERLDVWPSTVSEIESGRTTLKVEKLRQILSALGLRPEVIDWTLDYRQRVLLEGPVGVAEDPAEERRRERKRIAAEAGRALEEFVLGLLEDVDRRVDAYEERRRAPRLWRRLRRHPHEKRVLLVQHDREYQSWGLAELLCAESLELAARDPRRAVAVAELAVLVAGLASGEERWHKRVLGYCHAHLGNARRTLSDLAGAEKAFAASRPLWQEGAEADPGILNEARVLGMEASLRRDQRRFAQALELLEQALKADRGEERLYLLINQALTLEVAGEYERSIEVLTEVEPHLGTVQEPRLVFTARSNMVDTLSKQGRYEEASRRLPEVQELAAAAGEFELLRLLWVRGRVAAGLGREEEGLAMLEQVRGEFATRDVPYDRALVSLEMAVLYLEGGRTGRARDLFHEMAPVFKSRGIHREAMAALTLFRQGVEQERATAELARRVVSYLHRARHNPELRFEDGPNARRGRPTKRR